MSYNYRPNYENLVELVKQGGEAAVKASKQASQSRGYMAPIDVSMLDDKSSSDSDSTSILNNRLYEKFLQVRENNEALKEQLGMSVTKASFSNQPDDLVSFVASFEKFSATPYDDFKQTSIGYGSKATKKNQRITEKEAKNLLKRDLDNARKVVLKMKKDAGYDWNKNQIDALTSFTHNLGAGNFKKLTENGTRGDEEISDMLLEYKYAGGEVRKGLIKRREAELNLFNKRYEK